MCRLYALHANAPTRVECGLVRGQNALLTQSRSDLGGHANPDGWGIALYSEGAPVVERRSSAAFSDLRFTETAAQAHARTVVAHVRRASVGEPSIANTHPFVFGRWVFAHNGTVAAFAAVRPRLEMETPPRLLRSRLGGTDSELCFLWILSRIERAGADLAADCRDVGRLAATVGEAVVDLAGLSEGTGTSLVSNLNFVLTNGQAVVATRWNAPLHWLVREGPQSCDICGSAHTEESADASYRAAVIATEPICHGDWQDFPEHSVMAVDKSVRIQWLQL